ncbi:MAG TPA: hypothetical protein VF851_05945, partial [Steroidobacteraceae bacterium]
TLDEHHRTVEKLQEKALETAKHALEALGTHGSAEDLMHYGEFVMSLAMRVARAAKEGDMLGIGGELVSEQERRFIERLDQLVQERRLR